MRLGSFLRSRRLAAVLLVGLTLYTWVVTLVPLESIDSAAVAAWDARHPWLAVVVNALGLHRAYSSPVFIAAAALLTAATAACAWERTRGTVRDWRERRAVSAPALERLRTSPALILDPGEGVDCEDALTRAAVSLRRLGMRVRRDSELLTGTSGALGLAGSPLFHWALVGLFVFAAMGQLTRYEGYVDIVVGDTVRDAPGTYSTGLAKGPLAGDSRFTGVEMTMRQLDLDHMEGGVARGSAPLVRLTRGGATLREQWVYPNNPLSYGSLLIQRATSGPILVGTVMTAQTREREPVVLYFTYESKSPRRFSTIDPTTDATLTVEVTPIGNERVEVSVSGASVTDKQTIGVGQAAELAEGVTFTLDALTYYAQLQVVNDWSVPWIYAMFVLGIAAMLMTTFVPPRMVHVLAVDGPRGVLLHVATAHRRSDPAFPRRAERLLREGLTGDAMEDVTTSQEREADA